MPWINRLQALTLRPSLGIILTGLTLSACASHRVQVPPRLSLDTFGRLAIMTFSSEPSRSSLAELATQQFAEEVLASQGGIELLELGPADTAVARLLADGNAAEAAERLGREKNIGAVFFGELQLSGLKPSGNVSGGGNLNVNATVSGELSVRLVSGSTGGTLWRSSGTTSRSVGQLSTSGGRLPSISATDPNAAYENMVEALVAQVTRDFRPTWVKQ